MSDELSAKETVGTKAWKRFIATSLVETPEEIRPKLKDLFFSNKYRAVVIYGPGCSGKSTLLRAVKDIFTMHLGIDEPLIIPMVEIITNGEIENMPDQLRIQTKRFDHAIEEYRLHETLAKDIQYFSD